MSQAVKDAIAAGIATLTQVRAFSVAPFGYGSDLSCASDLDPSMAEVDGGTTLALAQALARRLDTPRGSLPDDKNYGISLRSYLNRGVVDEDLRSLGGQIKGELLKDDRVDQLIVTVTPNATGSRLSVSLFVTPVDPQLGPFTLTLAASDAALLIEEIQAAA